MMRPSRCFPAAGKEVALAALEFPTRWTFPLGKGMRTEASLLSVLSLTLEETCSRLLGQSGTRGLHGNGEKNTTKVKFF